MSYYNADDPYRPYNYSDKWKPHAVKTTNTSSYDGRAESENKYFVMSPNTKRTWCDFSGAIDHAVNLIDKGNSDEFLVVKVVARVKRRKPPIDVIVE